MPGAEAEGGKGTGRFERSVASAARRSASSEEGSDGVGVSRGACPRCAGPTSALLTRADGQVGGTDWARVAVALATSRNPRPLVAAMRGPTTGQLVRERQPDAGRRSSLIALQPPANRSTSV